MVVFEAWVEKLVKKAWRVILKTAFVYTDAYSRL